MFAFYLLLPLKLFHIPKNCLLFRFGFISDLIFPSSIVKRNSAIQLSSFFLNVMLSYFEVYFAAVIVTCVSSSHLLPRIQKISMGERSVY